MKKELLIVALYLLALSSSAQNVNNNFNSFRNELLSNYQEYRTGILDNYALYLNGVWEEYQVFKGVKKSVIPKPSIVPEVDKDHNPKPLKDPENIPIIPEDEPLKNNPITKPIKPVVPQKPLRPNNNPTKNFVFYGMELNAPIITQYPLKSVDNSTISKVWDFYHKEKVCEIADNLSQISLSLGLNDWLQYELVTTYTKAIYNSSNDRTLLEHFLLSNLGYDIRLAKNGANLVLLISFDQQVYERSFLVINGTRYYIFEKETPLTKSYSSCQIPNDIYRGRPIELGFINSMLNPAEHNSHNYHLSDGRISVSGYVNETAMKMIAHYPLCDINNYARSNVLPPFHEDLLRQLKPQLNGMNQRTAVSVLLHFVQYAFEYATDQQQHGYEKPYFIEENFYYPMNDCEDRSILFAYLVKNLVGLDVHLIQYPGHECTAVNFNDETISGDSYNYKGKRYLICDPTFIGASIGHCMPKYINEQPKIEF